MNMTNRKHVLCLFRTTKKTKSGRINKYWNSIVLCLCMVKLSPKQSTHKNSRVVTQL